MPEQAVTRSWLYVPADSERKLEKGLAAGADAVLLDLEDAVAPARKAVARELLARSAGSWAGSGTQVWVRVSQDALSEDLDAAVRPGLAGICLAKAESADQLGLVSSSLDRLERIRGLAHGEVVVMPLIETARGVLAAEHVARCPRVRLLQLGEQDLRADLALPPPGRDDEVPHPLVVARGAVVLASAAARLLAPVGPVSLDLSGADVQAETSRLRASGFGSRAVIHPRQIDGVHAAFAPTPEQVRSARAVLQAADAADGGAVADSEGRMVDAPVLEQARSVMRADREARERATRT